MAKYGIYGSGTCGKNIIEDGLADIGIEGNEFVVIFRRGASSNEERVFDYLIEKEATFNIIVHGNLPKILSDNAQFVNDIPEAKHVDAMLKTVDGLLILWDEDNQQELMDVIIKATDTYNLDVKELSNGLAPIKVAEEPQKEIPVKTTTSATTAEVSVTYNTPVERQTITSSDEECIVNVVMPNGTIITTQATMDEVRTILGLG